MLQTLIEELNRVARLGKNWNSYGAEAPNERARFRAEEALHLADEIEFLPNGVEPSAEGGVGLVYRERTKYAHLEFLNSGEIVRLLRNHETQEIYSEKVLPQLIAAAIAGLQRFMVGDAIGS